MKIIKILFLTLFFVTLKPDSFFSPVTINFKNNTNHTVIFEVITNEGARCHFRTPKIIGMGGNFQINLDKLSTQNLSALELRSVSFCPSNPEAGGQTWVTQVQALDEQGHCLKTLIFEGQNNSTCRSTQANQFAKSANLTITLSNPQVGRSSLVTAVAPTALSDSGVGGGTLSVDEAYDLSASSN